MAANPGPAPTVYVSDKVLDSYLGKGIDEICPMGYANASLNHCAHFVCHVTSLSIGYTCRNETKSPPPGAGSACLRVHELFHACPSVGLFSDAPAAVKANGLFVFVTAPSNVKLAAKTMLNVPRKHVGIHAGGKIWHYSNTKDRVVCVLPADFKNHYGNQQNELYFGTFPPKALVRSFAA